ncbi:MAG: metal ABC transporter ATP-binding protein [Chloroflexi bacterium]|nr:metal ABC transporter ATP-binding protein [Chloroflexota bacterium]
MSKETTQAKTPDPVLEFNHVWFAYDGEPVIEDVTFALERGQFAAILGPNGGGKTTMLRLALGLSQPSRGRVALFGETPAKFRSWGRVGYVPQATEGVQTRFPATAEEVVAQGLYRGFDPIAVWRSSGRAAVIKAMETVDVADLRGRRITSLSVGQQQRILIARALVREPELLILDEPLAGIDAAGQEQFHTLLRRLNGELGMTILLVSHDIGAVMREATSVACINRSLVFHGPTHTLTQRELAELYGFPVDVLMHDALHEHR